MEYRPIGGLNTIDRIEAMVKNGWNGVLHDEVVSFLAFLMISISSIPLGQKKSDRLALVVYCYNGILCIIHTSGFPIFTYQVLKYSPKFSKASTSNATYFNLLDNLVDGISSLPSGSSASGSSFVSGEY